jgi:hypothetical protein
VSEAGFAPDSFAPAEGGCLCGAVRYRVTKAPEVVDICHCRQCRKSSGAVFLGWIGVPADGFAWTRGQPAAFESSPGNVRHFCAACGTPLVMTGGESPDLYGITIGSLDAPGRFTPTAEGWVSQRLPWVRLAHPMVSHDEDNPGF